MLITVIEEIKRASEDGTVTVKEVWQIIESILEKLGVDVKDREILKF